MNKHEHDSIRIRSVRLQLYGHAYKDHKQQESQFTIFKNNVAYIEKFNSNNKAYKLCFNKIANQTNEELKATRNRLRVPSTRTTAQATPFRHEDVTKIPSSLNWRKKGAVTPVTSQGQSGKPVIN
ncbi:putative ananain protein [Helianthus anomalus]